VCWYSAVSGLGAPRAGLLTAIARAAAALSTLASGGKAPAMLGWSGVAVVFLRLAAGLRTKDQRMGKENVLLPLEPDLG
jgi:hypothetical protein